MSAIDPTPSDLAVARRAKLVVQLAILARLSPPNVAPAEDGLLFVASRGWTRADSEKNKESQAAFDVAQAATFGPMPFEVQPWRVRRRGRKMLNQGESAMPSGRRRRKSRRSGGYFSGRSSSSRGSGMTRRERRRMNRERYRSGGSTRRSRRKGRALSRSESYGVSRRSAKRARRQLSRRGPRSSVRSIGDLVRMLRGSGNRGWVCTGRTITGCGGGKKGRRGSRQIGVLY